MKPQSHERLVDNQVPWPLVSPNILATRLGMDLAELEALASKAGRHYKPVDVRPIGSNKKWRHLDRPTPKLKRVHELIQQRLLLHVAFPAMMFGSVRGRSIRENAAVHVGQPYVLTVDLRNCFPNTTDRMVFSAWIRTFGCSDDTAGLLTKLTTVHHRLPQGAPTSPLLANMTLIPMYYDVQDLASKLGLRFSFFVDDIAVSGERAPEALQPLIDIIRSHRHSVSHQKIHLMSRDGLQRVPGAVVNHKVSNGQERLEKIRKEIRGACASQHLMDQDLMRLRGLVYQAAYVCPEQGAALERLLHKELEGVVVDEGRDVQSGRKVEYAKCPSFARHRRPRGAKREVSARAVGNLNASPQP